MYLNVVDLFKLFNWDAHVHFFYLVSIDTRASQFIVSLSKYMEAMNNKFMVGMRFKMRFEGEESPERR